MAFKGDLLGSIQRRSDSSESEGTCANAFKSASETFDFVCYVIFFVLSLLVIGAQVYLRKRYNNPTTRKLLGPFYAAAVGCIAIGWLLQIINMLFIQCSASYGGYYIQTVVSLLIAFVVFYRIGSYLLLVVAIWGVTSVLGDRLGREGKSSSHKMSSFIIVGCVGLLALVVIIVESVYYSFLPDASITAMVYFNLGLHILRIIFSASWNLSILISLCLSIHSLSAIKSRFGIPTKVCNKPPTFRYTENKHQQHPPPHLKLSTETNSLRAS